MADLVLMPQMGISEESALLAGWLVAEGDSIKLEQPLFTLETGKSSFEELSKHNGVLLKILVPAGEEVTVGAPVAVIGQPGEKFDLPAGSADAPAPETKPETAPAAAPVAQVAAVPAAASGDAAVSPRARNLARELGIDASAAQGSGPEGRIIERDVKALAANPVAAKAAPAPVAATVAAPSAAYEDKPMTKIRKVIAENMQRSLDSTAQLTLNTSFDATRINALRQEMKNSSGYGLEKITLGDFVLYAVARTLVEFPDMNANLIDGTTMRRFAHAQLAVAVDTPRGLMVPVIRDADTLSLCALSGALKNKAAACREGAIDPSELSGGSFTVSNLGAMGIESFTPVLNPPQTGILGVCGLSTRPRIGKDGAVEFYSAMGLSLTFDHRALDGAPAAQFLKTLVDRLENFHLLLAK